MPFRCAPWRSFADDEWLGDGRRIEALTLNDEPKEMKTGIKIRSAFEVSRVDGVKKIQRNKKFYNIGSSYFAL